MDNFKYKFFFDSELSRAVNERLNSYFHFYYNLKL